MIITIPFKTPTINHLYGFRGFHKFLTKEAKIIKEEIKKQVPKFLPPLNPNEKVKVTIEIYENWLTKKGDVARKDISNREKFLMDSIFEVLEIDDKFIFEHTMRKIQSNEEKAIVTIEVME